MNSAIVSFFITKIKAKPEKNNRKLQIFNVLLAIKNMYRAFYVLVIYMVQMLK